jgi:hypothetical protein
MPNFGFSISTLYQQSGLWRSGGDTHTLRQESALA